MTIRGADGTTREVRVIRDTLRGPVSRFGNLPPLPASLETRRVALGDGRCVGVIRFEYWMPPVMPAMDHAVTQFRECAGMVLDLRGNLGGVAAMMMGVAAGAPALGPRAGHWIVWASYVYALGMIVRSIRYATASPEKRGVLIPIIFHFVLAAFLFVYGSAAVVLPERSEGALSVLGATGLVISGVRYKNQIQA